jgi:hypothetical protein
VALPVRIVVAVVLGIAAVPRPAAAPVPFAQSDIDALMKKVLARRDDNWKKLQQYVLEEHYLIDIRGPSNSRIWADRREYFWYPRDGFFIRSPLTVNGVAVPEGARRAAEEQHLRWVRSREEPDPKKKADTRSSISIGADGVRFTPGQASTPADDSPAGIASYLNQRRQPEFVESAYIMRLPFEDGRYAFVGRRTIENIDVLEIEYYPKRLFKGDDNSDPKVPRRERLEDEMWTRLMNKAALVTVWVDPVAQQIVKYTFDNVTLDFFPAAWLFRPTSFKASMTMTQAFKNVWLPREVAIDLGALFATGPVDVKYRIDYRDYQEAATSARIKR